MRNGRRIRGIGAHTDTDEAYPIQPADDAPVIRTKGEAIADENPQQRDQTEDGEAVHDRGQHVFCPDQPSIEYSESRYNHDEDEGRSRQNPCGVPGIDTVRRQTLSFFSQCRTRDDCQSCDYRDPYDPSVSISHHEISVILLITYPLQSRARLGLSE